MPVLLLFLLLVFFPSGAYSAYQQQLIPIIREIRASSAPAVSEWKTYVRVSEFDGAVYVSLVQIAELLNGHLRWKPVSKAVDLSIHNQTVRFGQDVPYAWINGRRQSLEKPTIKNDEGFWIPASFFASSAFYKSTRMKLVWPPGEGAPRSTPATPIAQKRTEKKHAPVESAQEKAPPRIASSGVRAFRRIVVDPGHGGKDPGAVGPHGVEEKTINLQFAQALADVLRETYDYEVLLTRMDDTFIPLEARSQTANRQNADLFVSIHCNASLSSKLKGYEVYFLSETATDPHADSVARLENASLALEGESAPAPGQVTAVLRSLVKNAYINEASALGSLVDRGLSERLSEPSLGVKQAAFYVLRGAEMPAILVETAFLSNPSEERLLQDENFRRKLVEGIAAGISAYDERKRKERG